MAVDVSCFGSASRKVVQRVLQVERGESACVDFHHDARPVHGNQPFDGAKPVRLALQHLVGGAALARLKPRAEAREICLLSIQGVVGPMQVVDEEREGGGVGPDQAALHLSLAAELNRGDQSNQERDQPHADAAPAARPATAGPRPG